MNTNNQPSNDKLIIAKAIEITIYIGIIILLIYWCFKIVQPFINIILWSIIITVAIHPSYKRLKSALGGRNRLTAILITFLGLIILLIPTYMLFESLIGSAQEFSARLNEGTLSVPSPSESVRSWPVIGENVYELWSLASNNFEAALSKINPLLKKISAPVLSSAAGAGVGILKYVVSIIIAGVLLANDSSASQAALAFARRLAPERGAEALELSAATVRSVSLGILGVALIQTFFAAIGMAFVGIPGAGIWALLVLIFAVIQLPTILILGPLVVYEFSASTLTIAVAFAIWSILVGISDAFLKPLLIGRGVEVPMLVIFIGAIGGFISAGIIGLFIGAVILAISYKLFLAWL